MLARMTAPAGRYVCCLVLMMVAAAPAWAHLALLRQGFECGDVPNTGDLFGYVVASGDFNNDGYDDLATAATWESNSLINTAAHGLVHINMGAARGLTHVGAALLSPGAPPADGSIKFGSALATADFNGDGFDDLAVGAPDQDIEGVVDAGGVYIYDGYAGGLQLAASWFFAQDDLGQTNTEYDNFGWSLATGDFNNDGFDDLAIGCLGEDSGLGAVFVVYSAGAGGLTATGADYYSPFTLGHSAGVAGGWFGKALATGDLDQDGFDDLVIGAPKSDIGGVTDSGRLYVLYGSAGGITTASAWVFDRLTHTATLLDESLELGWSLATGHFRDANVNAGPIRIAAGAPGRANGPDENVGAVLVLTHDPGARAFGGFVGLDYQQVNVPFSDYAAQDRYGETLAAGDFDNDGYDDLAVGVTGDNIEEDPALGLQSDAGSAYLLLGDAGSWKDTQVLTAVTFNDHVTTADNLGRGLAFGRFDGSGKAALAVGAPYGDYPSYDGGATVFNAGRVYIHAPWRQPRNRPHRGSAALDCAGNLVYAQRAWQRLRPASTTKTMTLQLACDAIDSGQSMDETFLVPDWIADHAGGSQVPLFTDEIISFGDLMKTMMTVSGNDAAMLLGVIISGEGTDWDGWSGTSPSFAAAMEAKAAALGLSSGTSLTNAAGIDSGDHYVTPYDWALLAYQVIQNPCVKDIVNTSPWEVERTLPPGQFGGFLNLSQPVQTVFHNGFVNGVKSRLASAVGNKGGHTPGAIITGLFNSNPPGPGGQTGAGAFGTWDDDEPYEGVKAGCSTCLGAELLAVAESACADQWPNDLALPEPLPTPWGTLQNWDPVGGGPPVGLVFPVNAQEVFGSVPQTQIDILRQNYALPTAECRQVVHRVSELDIRPGSSEDFGIAPYQQHFGFRIVNRGTGPIDLTVTATDPLRFSVSGLVAVDSSLMVPAAGGAPGTSFVLTVANDSSTETATVEVEELGYGFDVVLGDGVTLSDTRSALLTHSLRTRSETVSVFLEGLDPAPGNRLAVSAHHPDGTTSVDDGQPGLPRPVANGLLPNVPNPFQPSTEIRFDLRNPGAVNLVVYDIMGRIVRTLAADRVYAAGRHSVRWDGRHDHGAAAASGVYLVRLRTGTVEDSRLVMKLK